MKIQYMSDIHLEFGDMVIPPITGEVLVLAGDIGVGNSAVGWINEIAQGYKAVIYIPGNHEFYNNDIPELIAELSNKEYLPQFNTNGLFINNVHFFGSNGILVIDGIKFAMSTLWADMSTSCFYSMNDSRCITNGDHKLQIYELKDMFKANLEFLVYNKDADVVITHHCPHIKSINTNRYPDASMNSGYYTNILGEFEGSNIKHWICGHTHSATEYTEHGIQVHNNCRGYVGYGHGPQGCEVTHFNPEAYIEV